MTPFVLGYLLIWLLKPQWADLINLICMVLRLAPITAALHFPAPARISLGRLVRAEPAGQEFLCLLLPFAIAKLANSPRRVLWARASIAVIWAVSLQILHGLLGTND